MNWQGFAKLLVPIVDVDVSFRSISSSALLRVMRLSRSLSDSLAISLLGIAVLIVITEVRYAYGGAAIELVGRV